MDFNNGNTTFNFTPVGTPGNSQGRSGTLHGFSGGVTTRSDTFGGDNSRVTASGSGFTSLDGSYKAASGTVGIENSSGGVSGGLTVNSADPSTPTFHSSFNVNTSQNSSLSFGTSGNNDSGPSFSAGFGMKF